MHIIQVKRVKSNYEADKYASSTKRSYEALQDDSSTTDSGEATDNEEFILESNFKLQNRMPLPTLAMACERFQVSDRAGAAIASAVLGDYGVITADHRKNVIDKTN